MNILTSQSRSQLKNLSFYSHCSESITKHPWHSSSPMSPCLLYPLLSAPSVVLDVWLQVFKVLPPAPCSFNVTPASSHSCQMCSLHWQTVQVLRLVIFNGKFIWFGDMDANMIFMSSTLEPSEKVKTFNNLQSANFKRAIKMCVNGWWFSSTLSSSNLTSRATLESSSSSPSRCTCSFNYSSEFSSLNTIDDTFVKSLEIWQRLWTVFTGANKN